MRLQNLEARLALSDAATVGGLRAFGDRLAIRQRFHDERIHQAHQPAEKPAADLFAALEDARLDALGVRWLAGVAKNLLAHPGAQNDGLRWLAFEVFSGQPAPRSKDAMAARVRAALPSPLIDELRALGGALG